LKNKHVFDIITVEVECCIGFFTMARHFAVLLVICLAVGSLATTTTKPQVEQKTDASKDLCEWLPWQQQQNHKFNRKTTLAKTYARNPSPVMVFQAFQDQMACRECLAFRGCKVHREGMELKDRLVTREHKECRVQKESEVLSGLVGRVGHQE